jgi:putative transposase
MSDSCGSAIRLSASVLKSSAGMPRRRPSSSAGIVFHVMNRGVRRLRLFEQPVDYQLFLDLMSESHERTPLRLLAYCLMPNHFHFVVWPATDSELRDYMHWLTVTHSKRWHASRGTTGTGHVYQGRFKANPVQANRHFLNVCRYVERNALRAELVEHAEDWQWCSLSQRCRGRGVVPLSPWPVDSPDNWVTIVNDALDRKEEEDLRTQLKRGLPVGEPDWQKSTAAQMGISLEPGRGGRPKKKPIPGVGFQLQLPQ